MLLEEFVVDINYVFHLQIVQETLKSNLNIFIWRYYCIYCLRY